jgi:heme/copper-type cytochrome/quinol oxidase subunit 4
MSKIIYEVGFWSGLIAFILTVAFTIVQVLQLLGVLSYPLDEILIYGFSLCIVIPFLLEMLALHYITPPEKKFWSHAALIFTALYVAFVTANYVVQLATVIPMTLQGSSDKISILKQTPHSLFWDFDAIGYIFMGFATLFAIPVFEQQGFQRWVRYSFLVHSLATPLIVFVYFYPNFSEKLLLIAIPWGITAPMSMLLLAIMFKKDSELIIQTNEI